MSVLGGLLLKELYLMLIFTKALVKVCVHKLISICKLNCQYQVWRLLELGCVSVVMFVMGHCPMCMRLGEKMRRVRGKYYERRRKWGNGEVSWKREKWVTSWTAGKRGLGRREFENHECSDVGNNIREGLEHEGALCQWYFLLFSFSFFWLWLYLYSFAQFSAYSGLVEEVSLL